jgi:hypothetical protein
MRMRMRVVALMRSVSADLKKKKSANAYSESRIDFSGDVGGTMRL